MLYCIENAICEADAAAQSIQVHLTDSSVRNTLNKVRQRLRREKPEIPRQTPKDEILAGLFDTLISLRKAMPVQSLRGLSVLDKNGDVIEKGFVIIEKPDWIKALETVEYSINLRRSDLSGTRYYLDFIHGFIEQARMEHR